MSARLSHISLFLSMDEFFGSDEFLATFVPVVIYWLYSGIYEILGSFDNYRLHSKMDEKTERTRSRSLMLLKELFSNTSFKVPLPSFSSRCLFLSVNFHFHATINL